MPIIRILPGGRFNLNSPINIAINGVRRDIPIGEIVTVTDEELQIIKDTGATFTYGDGVLDGDIYADTLQAFIQAGQLLLSQTQDQAGAASTSAAMATTQAGIATGAATGAASANSDAQTTRSELAATIGGTANAITATTASGTWTNTAKRQFALIPILANTGPVTIAIDGQAAVAILDPLGNSLDAGALQPGAINLLVLTTAGFRQVLTSPTYPVADLPGISAYGRIGDAQPWQMDNDGTYTIFNLVASVFRAAQATVANLFARKVTFSDPATGAAGSIEAPQAIASVGGAETVNGLSSRVIYADGSQEIFELVSSNFQAAQSKVAKSTVLRQIAADVTGATASDTQAVGQGSGVAWVDQAGRAMLQASPEQGVRVAMDAQLSAYRNRQSVSTANWAIISARRASGINYDLRAIYRPTGAVFTLTSDTNDLYDFADPSIDGNTLLVTRYAGEAATRFAMDLSPLIGNPSYGILNRFRRQMPNKRLSFFGDSFVSFNAAQAMIDTMNAALGIPAWQYVTHGFGGRTISGTAAEWRGGSTGPNDSPPSTTYPGRPDRWDDLLVITDDMSFTGNGFTDISQQIAVIQDMVGYLRPWQKRFAILEPGLAIGGIGGAAGNNDIRNARWAAIVAAFPNNVIPVLAAMQASAGQPYMRSSSDTAAITPTFPADSTARDNAYVTAGYWPASTYANPGVDSDHISDGHPSVTKGQRIYGEIAGNWFIAKGWHL